ncbi:tetratricopeptide repeat protein [Embleya hyalina]|nr:tetratricopeptide repeat protein [Embleya hyalina]
MLRLDVCVDGRAVEFAGVVRDGRAFIDEAGFETFGRLVDLLLAGPEMIAAGAAGPWSDRIRRETHMYVREAGGEWLSLGRGPGRTRTPAEDPRATPLLAALTTDHAPVVAGTTPAADEPRARARAWAETMRRGGWRAVVRRTKRGELGLEVLAEVARKHPGVPRQRCAYVLTGDPRVPEALRWRSDELYTSWSKFDFLVDLRGLDDPRLPADAPLDDPAAARAAKAADVLAGTAPGAMDTLRALTTVASVYERTWEPTRPVFVVRTFRGLPNPPARPLDEIVTMLQGNPDDGALWLETGFAAYDACLLHVTDTAFRRATELGAGGGLPRLWRAWLSCRHDPHRALRESDVAATEGGVTGAARHLQAHVHEALLRDPDTALGYYAQATADGSGSVGAWIDHGALLLRRSRHDEAIRVFTEALEQHPDGRLWHWLGYARLMAGETDAALDCVEQALRVRPGMVREIVDDNDLAPLREHPRFRALPALAEEYAGPYHRAVRAGLRPDGERTPPRTDPAAAVAAVERLRDTYSNYEPCVVEAKRLGDGTIDPTLRAVLAKVGLPRYMGTFHVAHEITHGDQALQRYSGGENPDGWGGLSQLGSFYEDPYRGVAVDGETGEVFVTRHDRPPTYLAPDVATFLATLCEEAGEHEWRIAPNGLDRLDDVSGIGAGRLRLIVDGLDEVDRARLILFLKRHGALLYHLEMKRFGFTRTDFSGFDFAAHCPNLRVLNLRGATVDESVFAHPALERFALEEGHYRGARDIRVGTFVDVDGRDGTRLREISFRDCVVEADTLLVGPHARLVDFRNVLDEDYSEAFPGRLEFAGCEDLHRIHINAVTYWELTLRGHLPRLREVEQDATPYGAFTSTVVDASAKDEARYLRLIKKGTDFTKYW